jgi:hypothetical protein
MSQCALDADSNLKDASEIEWFNDPDDDTPIWPAGARCPQHNVGLTEKLKDLYNVKAPGLISQKKAVEWYRATQVFHPGYTTKIMSSTSLAPQPSHLQLLPLYYGFVSLG